MKEFLVSVKIGGSGEHVVSNKRVTIPEIAILRAVHTADAVSDIRPAPHKAAEKDELDDGLNRGPHLPDWTDADERVRLRGIYDNAGSDDEPVVDRLFGPLTKLPTRLMDVGIDPKDQARKFREQAAALEASASAMAADVEDEDLDDDEDVKAFLEKA